MVGSVVGCTSGDMWTVGTSPGDVNAAAEDEEVRATFRRLDEDVEAAGFFVDLTSSMAAGSDPMLSTAA